MTVVDEKVAVPPERVVMEAFVMFAWVMVVVEKVEVAEKVEGEFEVIVPVMLRLVTDTPPAKVLVPCPAETVIAPPNVEVAVEVAMMFPVMILPFRVVLARLDDEVEFIVPTVSEPTIVVAAVRVPPMFEVEALVVEEKVVVS